jgi:hypothetical protein
MRYIATDTTAVLVFIRRIRLEAASRDAVAKFKKNNRIGNPHSRRSAVFCAAARTSDIREAAQAAP